MKKILCVFLALFALALTGCGKNDTAVETTGDTSDHALPENVEIVHYYNITPDKEVWTEFLENDGSLTFFHNSTDGVFFNIGKNDLPAENAGITAEEIGVIIKEQCEELELDIISEDTVTIGGVTWSGVTADIGDGEIMQMLCTARNGVQYALNFFSPAGSLEAASAEMKTALDTFEFVD